MKKHLPIIVAIALPTLVVCGVLLAIYIPTIGLEPGYDLVFAVDNNKNTEYSYYYTNYYKYEVVNSRIEKVEIPFRKRNNIEGEALPDNQMPKLYKFDFSTKEVEELNEEDAFQLKIVKEGAVSPEGYRVNYTRNRGGSYGVFGLFGGGGYSNDYGWMVSERDTNVFFEMEKGDIIERYRSTDVIGWVKK